ncbi:alpha/beta-hydrolase [Xylariaceae sp. FL1272]|nr:alpha/beta-hydrolase [Xylariaceae sp. FL1272]
MGKAVFVLLHGAWHSPKCWSRLIAELEAMDYTAVAPSLPSCGSVPAAPDWEGDIQVIQKTVSELVVEHDVVVIAHSFSGMTAGTALHGFDKESCLSRGLRGGVVRLVYICAFIVPEGFQHTPHGTRQNMRPEMKTDMQQGTVTVSPKDAKELFYQDFSDAEVADLAKDLRPQSIGSYWSKTEHAAWRVIPTTYILTLKDSPSTVVAARHLVETARAGGNHKIDNVIEVESGHSPFINMPEWVAKTLIEEASRSGAET